jgi:S-adenosylmethionine:tRNA ribosyltransferase-isomerase
MKEHPLVLLITPLQRLILESIPRSQGTKPSYLSMTRQTDQVKIDRFYNLASYLPAESLMVMNNTGVIPARVVFTKDTGGKVEGLISL